MKAHTWKTLSAVSAVLTFIFAPLTPASAAGAKDMQLTRIRQVGSPEVTVTRRHHDPAKYRVVVEVQNVGSAPAQAVKVTTRLPISPKAPEEVEFKGPKNLDPKEKGTYTYSYEGYVIPQGAPQISVGCANCRK
jgi:hypothetical protein